MSVKDQFYQHNVPGIPISVLILSLILLVEMVVVVSNSSNKSFCLRLSSSSLSPHLLGRYCVELELRPPGHQTNQLGRPARGLQPAPGKSNTGLPFPPGCVCVCVSYMCFDIHECVWVCMWVGVFTRGTCARCNVPT